MITEKKLLSECGDMLVIDDMDNYRVKIAGGNYIVIDMGATVDKASCKFIHPNIITSVKNIMEFKHYLKNGGKKWTSKAGISHYIIVPKNEIYLLPQKGYSYVPAEINGVNIKFNVTGGTGGNGWTDYLDNFVSISVNHKLADMKKIADKAVKIDNEELIELEKKIQKIVLRNEVDMESWDKMAKNASPSLKKAKMEYFKALSKGQHLKVILKDGFAIKEAIITDTCKKCKKVIINDTESEYVDSIIPKHLYIDSRYKVKMSQVDWVATIKNFENSLIPA